MTSNVDICPHTARISLVDFSSVQWEQPGSTDLKRERFKDYDTVIPSKSQENMQHSSGVTV